MNIAGGTRETRRILKSRVRSAVRKGASPLDVVDMVQLWAAELGLRVTVRIKPKPTTGENEMSKQSAQAKLPLTEEVEKVKRQHKTTSAKPLAAFFAESEMTAADFARETGYSRYIANHWINEGEMPEHVTLLIEALRARRYGESVKRRTIILQGEGKDITFILTMAEKLNVSHSEVL